eukprot:tig00000692_g3214.t1
MGGQPSYFADNVIPRELENVIPVQHTRAAPFSPAAAAPEPSTADSPAPELGGIAEDALPLRTDDASACGPASAGAAASSEPRGARAELGPPASDLQPPAQSPVSAAPHEAPPSRSESPAKSPRLKGPGKPSPRGAPVRGLTRSSSLTGSRKAFLAALSELLGGPEEGEERRRPARASAPAASGPAEAAQAPGHQEAPPRPPSQADPAAGVLAAAFAPPLHAARGGAVPPIAAPSAPEAAESPRRKAKPRRSLEGSRGRNPFLAAFAEIIADPSDEEAPRAAPRAGRPSPRCARAPRTASRGTPRGPRLAPARPAPGARRRAGRGGRRRPTARHQEALAAAQLTVSVPEALLAGHGPRRTSSPAGRPPPRPALRRRLPGRGAPPPRPRARPLRGGRQPCRPLAPARGPAASLPCGPRAPPLGRVARLAPAVEPTRGWAGAGQAGGERPLVVSLGGTIPKVVKRSRLLAEMRKMSERYGRSVVLALPRGVAVEEDVPGGAHSALLLRHAPAAPGPGPAPAPAPAPRSGPARPSSAASLGARSVALSVAPSLAAVSEGAAPLLQAG